MRIPNYQKGVTLLSILLLLFFFVALDGADIKLKVAIDNARIKKTPELGGETIARLPLNTILTGQEKQGEWYKVTAVINGNQISGYIFEPYVEVVKEEEAAETFRPTPERTQIELKILIKGKMDEAKNYIRQETDIDQGILDLRSLLAKVFRVTDNDIQRELATEIYFWIGLGYSGQKDKYGALMEFKNMFEIDHAYTKELTRNIMDDEVMSLVNRAEDIYKETLIEYSIDIVTNPSDVKVIINDEEKGLSPLKYKVKSEIGPPKFTLTLEKDGYKPITEEIIMFETQNKKMYTLESLGRDVEIVSVPPGAKIYFNGQDTGEVTNATFPKLKLGTYKIKIEKEGYSFWEEDVPIEGGSSVLRIAADLTALKYSSVRLFGGPDSNYFELPKGIAVDSDNNFYIIDTGKMRVRKLNADFQPQTGWGDRGRSFRNVKEPAGITVDSDGFIYVTDIKNHNVLKFDKSGEFIKKWGGMGTGNDEFNTPLGIASDSNNDIYVADSRNHRVKKYSPDGKLKMMWGRRADGPGGFLYPADIAVNQKNEVYVVDRTRVQKFSSEGNFIVAWGKPGQEAGEFHVPMGVSIDSEGNIYVADSNNHRIQKFDQNGNFIISWGNQGNAEGQFNFPSGVAVDSRGYVFVIERDNKRVQVFGIVSE